MKHGFKEEVMAADAATPEAQPNVEQTMKESLEPADDPFHFYQHGWYSKLLPNYRRAKVNLSELERMLTFNLAERNPDSAARLVMVGMVLSAFMKVSLLVDNHPELFECIVVKACQAADLYPEEFIEAFQVCYPWVFDCNLFPKFETEKLLIKKGDNVMRNNDGPMNHLVWIHTIRLLNDKEPLKRLNIDMAGIEEVERRIKAYDLVEYYRSLHKSEPEIWPPLYITRFWREQGIEADFVPDWK